MISGFLWLIVVLLASSVAATITQQSQTTNARSQESGLTFKQLHPEDSISSGGSTWSGGDGDRSSSVGSSPSLSSSSSSLASTNDAAAIESEAHDLKNNNNNNNSESIKLGASAAAKRKSELAQVIAEDEEAVIAQVTERLSSSNLAREQQVNISGGGGGTEQQQQQQQSERGQPSWRTLGGGLQVRLLQTDSVAVAAVAAGGGGADEKVQQPVVEEHNQRRHHETSNSKQQQQQQVTQASSEETTPTALSNDKPTGKGPVVYTNQFVLEVEGGEEEARKLAKKHGFVYLNHILADFYHLEHRRLSKRSLSADERDLAEDVSIRDEPQVLLLERQVLKRRVKRDFLEIEAPPSVLPRLGRAHSQVRPPNQARPPPAQQILRPAAQAGGRNHAHAPQQQQQPPPTRPANQPAQYQRLSSAASLAAAQRIGGGNHLADHHHSSPNAAADGTTLLDSLEVSASTPSINFGTSFSSNDNNNNNNRHHSGPNQQQRIYLDSSTTQTPLISSVILSGGNRTIAANNLNRSGNDSSSLEQRPFNDPSWPLMWYLDGGAKNGFDLNVMAAWKMGYTGKGIVITILDDGLEKDHPDLQANYDPLASFDINGDDADPMPRYDVNDSNRHGTRCAGEVAAVPDNNICSIGIAYNSKVGGVRMLDGDVTDAVEARSLALNNQHIHIYSASWGPDDNGKTVDGPGELATRAFVEGVTYGRQGLGSIFVFASGNGGREHDNCNCDGYTNSIWTLSISSATENGFVPWYIEACSSTLATTYSSGSYEERQIATTDLHHSCTSSHTGTSASAPLAAGICALVLESNPRLTWRDMQHIVVRTAKPANLVAKDWRTNAMGRNVSHAFGYGLMDAAAMIRMAKQWTRMPDQYTCGIKAPPMEKAIPARGFIELKLSAQCLNVSHLEHVQSKVTLSASRRGELHIYLVSPGGTRSTLLAQRPNDHAEQGFRNWPFMTVHNWGESPNGIWTLEIHNDGKPQSRAYLKEWELILYGTKEDPNKHLDHLNAATGPPSTPMPSIQVDHPKRPSQPPPPAPLLMQQRPDIVRTPTTTPAAAAPQQHWSTYSSSVSSLPPPLPPLVAPARVTSTTRAPDMGSSTLPPSSSSSTSSASASASIATTQASYVTTFNTNTLVSSSSSRPKQQPASVGTKADFDIVSPAAERPNTENSHELSEDDLQTTTKQQTITRPSSDEPNITKPPVDSIEAQSHHPSTSKPISTTTTTTTTSTSISTQQAATNGLDLEGDAGNQIDLKLLSKDYRSSGDQSASMRAQLGLAQTSSSSSASNQQQSRQEKPKSSSSSSSSQLHHHHQLNGFIALVSALIMHHQLDQLVRHSINVI